MSFFSLTLILFLIMDPLGNLPSFLSLTKHLNPSERTKIIVREMFIALAIMVCFNYIGEFIFEFLSLSDTTLHISSGVILFLIAIKVLFTAPDSPRANLPDGTPFIFPLAVPLIAGPGLLATIMLFAHMESSQAIMIFAILTAWLISVIILSFSQQIRQILGIKGLIACERLIGMVLVIISVQRLMEGMLLFWKNNHHQS